MQVPLPIVITKEDKWFVASCPTLDVATQGETEQEARENMADLIDEYLRDEDTPKPELSVKLASLSYILTKVPKEMTVKWEKSGHFLQTK